MLEAAVPSVKGLLLTPLGDVGLEGCVGTAGADALLPPPLQALSTSIAPASINPVLNDTYFILVSLCRNLT